jgi:hypothetical protein
MVAFQIHTNSGTSGLVETLPDFSTVRKGALISRSEERSTNGVVEHGGDVSDKDIQNHDGCV